MPTSDDARTSDTFEASRFPLPIRLVNRAGSIIGKLGIRPDLSQDSLVARAQSQARLCEFGDTSFEPALSVLLNAIETEASLNFLGQFMARQMIVAALANRLKINAELQKDPELFSIPIERPLFIIGYPRTGTTLLQNLLALDPRNRTLRMYEALNPVPPHGIKNSQTDHRIEVAEKFVKMTRYIAPQVSVIHALNARGPDECLKLIENTFTSPHFLLYFHIPSYWDWLTRQDPQSFAPIYAFHRRQLQLLTQGQRRTQWVLKAPIHLFFLEALISTYPDARIVFLHRDPHQSISSFCSLLAVSRAMATDKVDLKHVGEFAITLYETLYNYAERARATVAKPGQIYDVDYHDLLDRPVATVRNIYKHFGDTPPPLVDKDIENWLAENPQHKHGIHRYSPNKFSLPHEHIARLKP